MTSVRCMLMLKAFQRHSLRVHDSHVMLCNITSTSNLWQTKWRPKHTRTCCTLYILTLYEQLKEGLWPKHLAVHIAKTKHSLLRTAMHHSSFCAPCHYEAPIVPKVTVLQDIHINYSFYIYHVVYKYILMCM